MGKLFQLCLPLVLGALVIGPVVAFGHTASYGAGDNYDAGHDGHDDNLDGNAGDDNLRGQGHGDSLKGGPDRDIVGGDGSNDDVQAGDGQDNAFGGAEDDEVDGGPGADNVLVGGSDTNAALGSDTVRGGGANDAIAAHGDHGNSPDDVHGGDGYDTCYIDNNFERNVVGCELEL